MSLQITDLNSIKLLLFKRGGMEPIPPRGFFRKFENEIYPSSRVQEKNVVAMENRKMRSSLTSFQFVC